MYLLLRSLPILSYTSAFSPFNKPRFRINLLSSPSFLLSVLFSLTFVLFSPLPNSPVHIPLGTSSSSHAFPLSYYSRSLAATQFLSLSSTTPLILLCIPTHLLLPATSFIILYIPAHLLPCRPSLLLFSLPRPPQSCLSPPLLSVTYIPPLSHSANRVCQLFSQSVFIFRQLHLRRPSNSFPLPSKIFPLRQFSS